MDYSAHGHDPDPAAGASPWATSPHPTTTTFPSNISETLTSPTAGPFGSALGPGHAPELTEDDEAVPRPGSSGTDAETSGPEENTDDLSQRLQGPQVGEPYTHPHHPHQHQRPDPARTGSKGTSARAVPQYKLHAKITSLERSNKKDPILRFDVSTNLPRFRTTQFRDVRRLHSEFVKLQQHLISSNPEAIVPAVPPAVTSAGAGTDEDEARVKASLQRWLNYVCSNDVLMRDEEMVFFVESDFGYSPVVRLKQPATGVRRRVIKQFAPPPDDTPELANARPIVKAFYLGTMESGQKVDKLVKYRKGMFEQIYQR
jgi:hypothetical protein